MISFASLILANLMTFIIFIIKIKMCYLLYFRLFEKLLYTSKLYIYFDIKKGNVLHNSPF